MTEIPPDLLSSNVFDAYRTKNIIEEGHERALEYQSLLRELRPQVDSAEFDDLIAEATKELDDTTGHMGMDITVSGNIRVLAIDPRGIDIDSQDFDTDAVREASHYIEDTTFESMGYLIEPQYDDVVISHIAKGGLSTLISTTKYGDLYMSNRIYIPIDGTAFVELAHQPERPSKKVLELYADDLLQEIDIALLNSDNQTDALRLLGDIDLSDYKHLIDDDAIAQALNEYITNTLTIGGVTIYQFGGAQRLTVKMDDESYSTAYIDPNYLLSGHIDGVVIDEDDLRFSLHTCMPFSDNTTRDVIYPLNSEFTIQEHPVLKIK